MPAFPHNSLGLYFSIPFCRAKCTYCNFASGVYPASEHARYVDRLILDLENASSWAQSMQVDLPQQVDTIYFGGGTPVLLAPELFTRIFASIRGRFQVDTDAEITVECAPGQLSDETLASMVVAGVNRVSLGVQSFVDREAALSGRLHTRAQVLDDLRRLRAAGIASLNIDLLAGLAEQTTSSWRESLAVLAETGVPHASIYMLEIDEDSRLGRELISGGARYSAGLVPTDDAIAQMYEEAVVALGEAGLQQYEISNFSQAGHESRHNLRYWAWMPRRCSGQRTARFCAQPRWTTSKSIWMADRRSRPLGLVRRSNWKKRGFSDCGGMLVWILARFARSLAPRRSNRLWPLPAVWRKMACLPLRRKRFG